ncbi:PorT family protein [Brachyspira aalborgi]|uniref:PorT family protein n=1 Tax=Brachyspira aalborgi TaxID=29522 RepID=UPI0011CB903A|nr:PorT family protein [Brachyspira aalborgi]TXJ16703.1 PorT family protein [Brachyspira aalborgi]TXJ22113.1 PorT family protein [Brachyspira aalborgi]TXJ50659.1 PorT family protein [Brachyspira aalborgi]
MKYLRKIFTTMALMTIFSVSVFAKSGFEFHYNALLGVGVSFPTTSMKDMGFKSDIGFDGTGLFQIGYMRQVKEGFGISYLLELGYNFSSYSISGKLGSDALSKITGMVMNYPDMSVILENYFFNIQVGLFPKFNFGNFSIGIGGGIKVPISGETTTTINVTAINYEIENTQKLSRTDIADMFNPPIFGYVKTSLAYSFYLTDKVALDVGLYLSYDIMQFINEGGKDEYGGTLNTGIIFGLKFGGKVD